MVSQKPSFFLDLARDELRNGAVELQSHLAQVVEKFVTEANKSCEVEIRDLVSYLSDDDITQESMAELNTVDVGKAWSGRLQPVQGAQKMRGFRSSWGKQFRAWNIL